MSVFIQTHFTQKLSALILLRLQFSHIISHKTVVSYSFLKGMLNFYLKEPILFYHLIMLPVALHVLKYVGGISFLFSYIL